MLEPAFHEAPDWRKGTGKKIKSTEASHNLFRGREFMPTKKASGSKSAPKKSTSTKAAGGKPTKKRPSTGIADRAARAINAAVATTTDAVRAAGEATGIGGANKKRRGAK